MKTEYDGWYVDFSADFSCPTNSAPMMSGRTARPDCMDRVITRGTGTAPKGMMLEGTMKMFGPDGSVTMSQTTETLELNRNPLDAALFDIPQGYQLAGSSQDLYAVSMPTYGSESGQRTAPARNSGIVPPAMAVKTVALNISMASNASNQSEIDSYVRSKLAERGMRVVSGTADYSVNIQVNQIKESTASKIGGMFGKVTGTTNNVGKVDIDMSLTLAGKSTGSSKVKSKFDGPLMSAVRTALDQALDQLLSNIAQ
jgi:hypothetical protein